MTDYTPPEERTYEQMLEVAKAISPEARVRAIDFGQQQWEIYIPSPFVPTYFLPENYKGTAAWSFSQEDDGTYGDQLSRWGYKNGYSGLPIEAVADYYNLHIDFANRQQVIANELDKQVGFIPMNEIVDWEPITREIAAQYIAHRKQAAETVEEDYVTASRELNEKWSR